MRHFLCQLRRKTGAGAISPAQKQKATLMRVLSHLTSHILHPAPLPGLSGRATLAALAFATLATPVAAEGGQPVLGRELVVTEEMEISIGESQVDGYQETLIANGRVILNAEMIYLIETHDFADGIALIGQGGLGSHSCSPGPFVVWITGAEARIEGPLDTCDDMRFTRENDRLVFRTHPVPGSPTHQWVWTPEAGFFDPETSFFTPGKDLKWHDFSELDAVHPLYVMDYKEVWQPLEANLTQSDLEALVMSLDGIGSGTVTSDGYAGEACDRFDCGASFGRLWIDQDRRGIYAMWVHEEEGTGFYPAARADWPQYLLSDAAEYLEALE